ncbi:PREDICTED: uncharacterized protein LOC105958183 [Erythranthe guttata]|uniref:uncharacterized protein LOC105958183 n=1 Tax=Erythranthe guttata TaxID=4155 RepID=UPI00064D7B16|nr:PREDICTED: uncharacterized protein LOC105958183 [Erythranthe guttata]|eukprot:XP_012837646.1 PREDICTED: uncharacterized protein LOC105958183 [Erythranthe guttata]
MEWPGSVGTKAIYDDEGISVAELPIWSNSFLQSFHQSLLPNAQDLQPTHPSSWLLPSCGTIKINFDVAFPCGNDHYRVAMVARGSDSVCRWWSIGSFPGKTKPVDGEAHAALYAMRIARSKGWDSIILEGDCLQEINPLRLRDVFVPSFGAYIEGCINMMSFFSRCTFAFIRRQGNSLAHSLATMACMEHADGISLPSFLASGA